MISDKLNFLLRINTEFFVLIKMRIFDRPLGENAENIVKLFQFSFLLAHSKKPEFKKVVLICFQIFNFFGKTFTK